MERACVYMNIRAEELFSLGKVGGGTCVRVHKGGGTFILGEGTELCMYMRLAICFLRVRVI